MGLRKFISDAFSRAATRKFILTTGLGLAAAGAIPVGYAGFYPATHPEHYKLATKTIENWNSPEQPYITIAAGKALDEYDAVYKAGMKGLNLFSAGIAITLLGVLAAGPNTKPKQKLLLSRNKYLR